MHRTRIKICGLTRECDVQAAVEFGADALGFVLYDRSPRAVSPARAAQLARELPPFVTPVLLFVNAERSLVREALDAVPDALLQFHGDETAEECRSAQRPYLRAVRMAEGIDLLDWTEVYSDARGLVLDAHVEGFGGGGKVFDWSLVRDVGARLVLSGGLNPSNVADGIRLLRPWAVDVSSGVESSKGQKDPDLIRQFCEQVRLADSQSGADLNRP